MISNKNKHVSSLAAAVALACASTSASAAFTDVTDAAGLGGINTARGVSVADQNNDGCPDVMFTTDTGVQLFRNNCDATFTDITAAVGLSGPASSWGNAWADYDGDGDLDVYIGSNTDTNVLYRNDNGVFTDVSVAAGVSDSRGTAGVAWADYDGDGDLDMFAASRFAGIEPNLSDRLWQNNGDGTFTDVAATAGVAGLSSRQTFMGVWFDYDNDLDQDLYLAVDFGSDVLYQNNGDGTFTNVSIDAGIIDPEHGMGVSIGDINFDGCMDVFSSNNTQGDEVPEHQASALYINNCDGTFTNAANELGLLDRGVVEWGGNFVDYDNDADLDLSVVAGGMLTPGQANVLYENFSCSGDLTEVTAKEGVADSGGSYGSVWLDFDMDGDLDWIVANGSFAGATAPSVLYRNDGPTGHFLRVELEGATANTNGIGARVEVTSGGRTQVREIRSGTSYVSSEEAMAFFGLGVKDAADSVRVSWPSGAVSELTDVAGDQTIVVAEDFTPPVDPLLGSIQGLTVTRNGAVVADVHISVKSVTTNLEVASLFSDASGNYAITDLPADDYRFLIEKAGFRTLVTTITLAEGENLVQNLLVGAPLVP